MYFGGVEGGATHSNLVICDETGIVRGKSKGPGTNHWAVGIEECANRIVKMVNAAKEDAGLPKERPLDSLGLTLSGCAQDSSNAALAAKVQEIDSTCANAFYVATDTAGSLFTAAPDGGMVMIAGTGSNALLRTPGGKLLGCGGWGHLLGDEGSAYWIAHRAVKMVFDDEDGLRPSPHPTHRVWETIKEHFAVDNRDDLLPHAYKDFEKSKFAGLAVKVSSLAFAGDDLSLHLFAEAGSALAAHVAALALRAGAERLRVVCVGSVWHSWDVLRPGFLDELQARRCTTELELVRLRVSSAMGAAWLAAKQVNFTLPRDDSAFCQVFYTYRPNSHSNSLDRNANGAVTNGTTQGNGAQENGTTRENGDQENCTAQDNGAHENATIHKNGNKQGNGTWNGNSHNVEKVNGNHTDRLETCGCGDWRNWS